MSIERRYTLVLFGVVILQGFLVGFLAVTDTTALDLAWGW